MAQAGSKFAHTLATIENEVRRCAHTGQFLLPSLSAFAEMAQVSVSPVIKALRNLEKKGLIEPGPGRRAWIAGHAPPTGAQPCPPASHSRWETVCGQIRRDILYGRYRHGHVFPSVKELCASYSANFRTIRKAMTHLAAQQLVEPFKRTYRICTPGRPATSVTLFVIVPKTRDGMFRFANVARGYELLRALEGECANARIAMTIVPYTEEFQSHATLQPFEQLFRRLFKAQSAIGTLFCHYDESRANRILKMLVRTKSPVAVYDEMGVININRSAQSDTPVMGFGSGYTPEPGMDIGRHLVDLGHRHCVYVTAFPEDSWSSQRFEALRNVFESAGGSVQSFGTESLNPGLALEDLLSKAGTGHSDSVVAKLLRQPPAGSLLPANKRNLRLLLIREWMVRRAGPLFEKAIMEARTATAWVGCNDDMALAMINFLHSKKVRVPADISVVGFDNDFEARVAGLTTYDFNVAGIAHACLSFILNPSLTQGSQGKNRIEIKGRVMPRNTTAKPRSPR